MIRKNSLLCKLIRIKTSSKFLFDTFMAQFRPELETCPICNSTGNCHIHDYYRRSIIDFDAGQRTHSGLCVLRVFCDSCEHAHAVLPDAIIPYSSFSLLFVLRLLGQYFADLGSVEQLCERFGVSQNLFYKWLKLWNFHKQRWLGVLADSGVIQCLSFGNGICQISSDMCPAGCAFCIRYFVIPVVVKLFCNTCG